MKSEAKTPDISFLKEGTEIVGNIESKEELYVAGKFKGTITCEKLIVLHTAQIDGDIVSPWIAIWGIVNGNIISTGTVSLKEQARVIGSIHTSRIEIEPGAEFNGDCYTEQKHICIN